MPFTQAEGVPVSTYRLQLRKEFAFPQATRLVPLLHELGITHCYCSPVLMSAPGSTHGYDVNDYHRIDAELGGHAGFQAFARELRERRMGVVLDFVPNHMGIHGSSNRWWQDVLECGPKSPHADFFDVDWNDANSPQQARVLVPVLEDQYGLVLEAGKLAIGFEDGAFSVRYHDHRFPVGPGTYAELLSGAAARPECSRAAAAQLESLADAFRSLPEGRGEDEPIGRRPRNELKAQLASACAADPQVAAAIEAHLADVNGRPDDPESHEQLDALLSAQHYRLAHWKTGAHEINYRRFFAIDTLIGLRIENPKVFHETHRLVESLMREDVVTGLRIDHIDGLRNPIEYLERLQALARGSGNAGGPFYVVVEKILERGETLDARWQTHGTTGYEFIQELAGLLVAAENEDKFDRVYREFTGDETAYEDLVYANKRLVLDEMFANAVLQLSNQLATLVAHDRRWRDLTRFELAIAVREIMAALGVYRIYRRMNANCRPEDREQIERACEAAIRRNPRQDPQGFNFVRDVLVGTYPPASADADFRAALWRWVLTWQQYTGAIMAKAVEDTTFYVYNRFIALNEVGGDPAHFGAPPAEFHRASALRRETSPHGLLATSTHDTKLGEDVRARLYALSELPHEWHDRVRRWRDLNARHKTVVDGRAAPDANEEYRLYQTLLGCWPAEDFVPDDAFRARLRDHVRKATNEAKRNTHWTHPNEAWLNACDAFVDAILSDATAPDFLRDFRQLAPRLAHLGMVNSLTQLVLKITVPGVPDFYQGSELWNLTLVDPDNRQLVDWGPREAALAQVETAAWHELLRGWRDGRVKFRVTRELLQFRRAHARLFQEGTYEPLAARGRFADHVVAFRRTLGSEAVIVVVPRLTSRLGTPPLGLVWEDTELELGDTTGISDVLTAAPVKRSSGMRGTAVADLLTELPFAVLAKGG